MIYSNKHNYVYYEVPKTGSSSIKLFLKTYYGGMGEKRHVRKVTSHTVKIASVRNPYARVVSQYFFEEQRGRKERQDIVNFDMFLDYLLEQDKHPANTRETKKYVYFTQSKFLYFVEPTHIIKQENIWEDLQKLPFFNKNIQQKLAKVQQSVHDSWIEYYNKEREEKVYNWALEDFKQFNYEREYL